MENMRSQALKFSFFFILLSIVFLAAPDRFAESESDPYLGQLPISYLIGQFPSEKILASYKNPGDSRAFLLRKETLSAYLRLVDAYKKDHPEERQIPFIVSAQRSFNDQKGIWEDKFTGKRKMRETVQGKSPTQIVTLILEFSSAPGTSRHHWGTDIDINALENSYFEKGGRGEKLYQWMIKNASKYGFCQPYSPKSERGNKGYNEEKWHWSYAKLANQFQKDWEEAYKKGTLNLSGKFLGSNVLGELPLEYVHAINPSCRSIR
ncbi:serine-type D-Ala-D-Ala carboxypeptidase [Leptospira fainei serovar Hurstbridge str. BUT 6]|uniref:Serine-type D-Ala-D-Ala carboxypeptidase n=1 Tax=Leptospira fainei serovar Hurstbridge str. BUT 6 TaxID=1193011 RepID=S3VA69_9LEPT|nr:M15 family metallopeptidase [Leptospira fainei]EPG73360.1 serine-type D-Ala-D-Ala carboxypeptidase [Leptospira fainei serovar Hurstbridge str. BUT 6]